MKDCRKISMFFTQFFFTQICLFWHNSPRNDENKKIRKNQNFDPPNFWTPLNFWTLEDLVTMHPYTKFGEISSKGVGARSAKASKTDLCPGGTILTRRGRHFQGMCAVPLCTYAESFKSFRRTLRQAPVGPYSLTIGSRIFQKNQNFDSPNFPTPLTFSGLKDLVKLHRMASIWCQSV